MSTFQVHVETRTSPSPSQDRPRSPCWRADSVPDPGKIRKIENVGRRDHRRTPIKVRRWPPATLLPICALVVSLNRGSFGRLHLSPALGLSPSPASRKGGSLTLPEFIPVFLIFETLRSACVGCVCVCVCMHDCVSVCLCIFVCVSVCVSMCLSAACAFLPLHPPPPILISLPTPPPP